MSISSMLYFIRISIENILLLSAPILITALVVGLLISIFQAITSIQDQTLSFVPKIICVLLSLLIFGTWIITNLVQYTYILFSYIKNI